MFKPGHLNRTNAPGTPGVPAYNIDVFYEVPPRPQGRHADALQDGRSGIRVKSFTEEFDMHRDTAFNFASRVAKAAATAWRTRQCQPHHARAQGIRRDVRGYSAHKLRRPAGRIRSIWITLRTTVAE